ncbi:hypothetical protein B0H13DRAFT_2650266 [Mycena leptocephala]|nr:hypothetical protein B0H13DRAFT_2650266 [Mycena leptocephala]
MLWASKRRKSRPDVPPQIKASSQPQARRSSLGSPRLPFAPLDPHQAKDAGMPDPQNLYGRAILSPDEQQRVARSSPSPPPNFSLPRRDPSSSSNSAASSTRQDIRDTSDLYTTNALSSFSFGPAIEPPSPGRSIGPLDEVDEDDMRRRADETPRQSLAGTVRTTVRRDPRTPTSYYSPSRSDAASHHTFGTSSASSLSSPSRSGSRSRTTSSTTHTSVDDYLGGVTFNPIHHHPTLVPDVEFDSEEEFSEEYDHIEVSSARGGGSIEGAQFEAAFERQMYSDNPFTGRRPSLPMAIPGVSPDDIMSGRREREREGSLATLRRPSRSLDDQVSVLSIGESTHTTSPGVPVPPPQPVSVPETDGDWRSLSARAAAHRPPTPVIIPTLPVFAASFSAGPMSAGPISGGGGGGSAGFDNFGFDLDWSTMKAGITGLDMNDVAVHARASVSRDSRDRRPSQLSLMLRRPSTASGGSVMYDPDTFSAAVRGWGGEEYEKQRKYWTFRRDTADGRGGVNGGHGGHGGGGKMRGTGGGTLSPVRSITSGRVGTSSILSGHDKHGHGHGAGERPKHMPWRGMALNAEEIWNSSLVGSFKVRRIELRPQKPQQRVTIDPFRGPFTLGPKPPHDGAYTNIHKHSKVMAFSIHRHYKPTRAPPPDAHNLHARGSLSAGGAQACIASARARRGYGLRTGSRGAVYEERRRPTAMILLAPRHVQEAYTSTNTTKGLRSHGLLDEGRGERDGAGRGTTGRERERERDRETRSTGRSEREEAKRKEREKNGKGKSSSSTSSKQSQTSSAGTISGASVYRDNFGSPPLPTVQPTHTYPPPASAPFDSRIDRDAGFIGPSLAATRSASASRRKRRDSLDDDDDSEEERISSRTTHNEAFSTMDASSIDQMVLAADTRYGDGGNPLLSLLRRTPVHTPSSTASHQVYQPPWVTLQSRVKQEERKRRHDVLSNSFEDVGLLPPKKSTGGSRAKKAPAGSVDIFAQVPPDALFMLLPLWPGPTDPVSERNAKKAPHEIPPEQRQYLLVSYKPTDERPAPSKKRDGSDNGTRSKKGSSHSSPTSSAEGAGAGRGCDILLTSYHISARLVSHADLQGSGIATRDHGLLVIGRCESREAGVEFDPEGLVKMGLCIPVPPEAGAAELQEEPVAELTPIGKAVLEMAWIGCVAVTSFGPAGAS